MILKIKLYIELLYNNNDTLYKVIIEYNNKWYLLDNFN